MKLMIADDQEIIREGLKLILSLHEEVEVIGEAASGEEVVQMVKEMRPEVILMDIRMPGMNGIEATKIIKEKYPEIKIIILTTFDEDEYIFQGLKYGADGYLLKDSDSKEIVSAIKNVLEGEKRLNSKVTTKVIEALNSMKIEKMDSEKEKLLQTLTPREIEVTRLVLKGMTNKDIAKNLFVTEGTIKNYVSRILEKLELGSRSELIILLNNVSF